MATNVYLYEDAIYFDSLNPSRYYGFTVSFTGHIESVSPFGTPQDRLKYLDLLESFGLDRWDAIRVAGLVAVDLDGDTTECFDENVDDTILGDINAALVYEAVATQAKVTIFDRESITIDRLRQAMQILLEIALQREPSLGDFLSPDEEDPDEEDTSEEPDNPA